MDGGRVFRAFIWGTTHSFHRATTIAATVGRVIAYLFIFFGVWQIFTGNIFNGLWIAFIGWFLESAANGQLNQQHFNDSLVGHTVAQAMTRNYAIVQGDISLQRLADEQIIGAGKHFFIIEEGGKLLGLLTLKNLNVIPRDEWTLKTVIQAMTPIDKFQVLKSDTSLSKALEEMNQEGLNQLPVVTNGQVQGILSRESVNNFLSTLQELTLTKS